MRQALHRSCHFVSSTLIDIPQVVSAHLLACQKDAVLQATTNVFRRRHFETPHAKHELDTESVQKLDLYGLDEYE